MKKIGVILVFLSLASADLAIAQDPAFSQFYANPLYLNPALAGSARCPRAILNYRNQWPNIPATYVTYAASYDEYFSGISGGIGIQAYHDRAGTGVINTNNFSAMYAYQVPIDKNLTAKLSLQAGFYQRAIDWSQLTFGDQIHKRYGFIYQTNETFTNANITKFDMSAGGLIFTDKLYAGFAAHHLTRPNESFFVSTESKLPIKYTGHAGALIPLNPRHKDEGAVSPNIIYQRQGDFSHLNLGMYVNRGPITGGVWYRWNDALIFLVGLYTESFRVGYSYDVTVSRLGIQTGGAHEISVTSIFPCKRKKVKFRDNVCPHF